MENIKNKLVIIAPYYEDLQATSTFLKELFELLGRDIYVVVVDDGSSVQPLTYSDFSKSGLCGAILRLNRNVGHQHAIAIALSWALPFLDSQQFVILMDSDGEDSPSQISTLISELKGGGCDVVVASRMNRSESMWFRICYRLYKWVFMLLTGKTISFGNFMALNFEAVKRLTKMRELSLHIAGSVLRSRLRVKACKINRGIRYAGISKMSFISLALHGFRSLMVFTENVLIRVGIACLVICIVLIVGAIGVIFSKLFGLAIPGWASVILGIFAMMLIQTGTLALMTLLLTGILRSNSLNTKYNYEEFIEVILTNN